MFLKKITAQWIVLFYTIASLISFWRALSFTFSKDDWLLLWGSLYHIRSLDPYWIHPATILEAFVFAHIFGGQAFWWVFFGFLLRVAISFAVFLFVNELTKSRTIGFVSGLCFATSYAGLESIGFISAHAGAIALFFLTLSFYFLLQTLNNRPKKVWFFLVCYVVGFLFDPGRVLPSLLLMPLLVMCVKNISFLSIILKRKLPILLVLLSIFVVGFLYTFFVNGSLLSLFIQRVSHNYFYAFQKIYLFGNYFAAIGNLLIGWIYPVTQDPQNTATYSKTIARIGFIFVLFAVFSFGYFIKKRRKQVGLVAFFSLWIVVFYISNWLFEPRAPMAGSHRYLLFSGVGFSALIAYSLSFLKKKWLVVTLGSLFIVCNIFTSNKILQYQQTYRSAAIVNALWSQVFREVPSQNAQYVFVFSGQQPLLSQSIELSSGIPFALERKIANKKDFPILVHDIPTLLTYLCHPVQSIPLKNVFAWVVKSPSILLNTTEKQRTILQEEAAKQSCVLQ